MSEKASSNPNLLLVDDDKSLLRLLTIRLEGEGYDVTAVEDGQSALRKLLCTPVFIHQCCFNLQQFF